MVSEGGIYRGQRKIDDPRFGSDSSPPWRCSTGRHDGAKAVAWGSGRGEPGGADEDPRAQVWSRTRVASSLYTEY